MSADVVLDTSVLLYSISLLPAEQHQRSIAIALIASNHWGTCTQVLQEFYVNAVRGKVPALTEAQALDSVGLFMRRPCVGMSPTLMVGAVALHQRYKISYWDAAVLVSAKALGAGTLYSEDLIHGQIYDGVRVENPFI